MQFKHLEPDPELVRIQNPFCKSAIELKKELLELYLQFLFLFRYIAYIRTCELWLVCCLYPVSQTYLRFQKEISSTPPELKRTSLSLRKMNSLFKMLQH